MVLLITNKFLTFTNNNIKNIMLKGTICVNYHINKIKINIRCPYKNTVLVYMSE